MYDQLHLAGIIGILFFFFTVPTPLQSQEPTEEDLIQFSGMVKSADSLRPVPYVNIYIKNTNQGTVSNYTGFFSFVAQPGDTIVFSSIGFKTDQFVIPDTLTKDRYSVRQYIARDTIQLPEAVIYPWSNKAQFKDAFVNMAIPKDNIYHARTNLDQQRLNVLMSYMKMDGKEASQVYLQQQAQQNYYQGQYPPLQIFNPMAWSRFFKALEEGKFKDPEKEEEDEDDKDDE